MSPVLGIIGDSRLVGHIFEFAPSSSLPQVCKEFKTNTNLTLTPILVKKCLQFVEMNKKAFPTLFEKLSTILLSKQTIQPLKTLCACIKSFAQANGNVLSSEETFDPLSLARQVQEEDESLILFYQALRQRNYIPGGAPILQTAYKIREFMLSNRTQLLHVRHLNLSGCQLVTIPKEINYFQNVVLLNLSGNKIKQIPQGIGGLSKLLHLDLSKNRIHSWDKKSSLPHSLINISLHNNQLTKFPEMLLSLPRLSQLNLAFNSIEVVPVDKTHLLQLTQLDISHNEICKIPTALSNRKNLEIDFSGNRPARRKDSRCERTQNL